MVVKQIVGGVDVEERYAREVTALRLAGRVQPPVVPAVLGTDDRKRVIVLEHLVGQRPPLDWIVGYAQALARLHAAGGPDITEVLPRWSGPGEADVEAFLALAEALGARVAPEVAAELHALIHRLDQAPGTALLHGDPCPGNDLHTAAGVTFIDLEQASWGSGLVELAYLRIGFPTCWCVTTAAHSLVSRAESAYATVWRAMTGTELHLDLADACAGWLIRGDALVERALRGTADQLAHLIDRDWEWGTVTARQRLAYRLAVVGQLTADRGDLRGLGALCSDLRHRMLTRWPTLAQVPSQRPYP